MPEVKEGLEALKNIDPKIPLKFLHFQMGTITLKSPCGSILVHIQMPENQSKIVEGMVFGDLVREDNLFHYEKTQEYQYFSVIEYKDTQYLEPDFLGRLNLERQGLQANINLLSKFLDSGSFKGLSKEQKSLMTSQLAAQKKLVNILNLRYENLNGVEIKIPKYSTVDHLEASIDKLLELKQQYDFTFMGSSKFHDQLEPLRVQIELLKHQIMGDVNNL